MAMRFRRRIKQEEAEEVYITAAFGKERSPVGVAFLTFFTLGIYFIYWHYKVNKEMITYDFRIEVSPSISAAAVSLGWLFLFVSAFVSVFKTVERAVQMFALNETEVVVSPGLAAFFHALIGLGFPMLSLVYPPYLQAKLNRFWRLEAAKLTVLVEKREEAA